VGEEALARGAAQPAPRATSEVILETNVDDLNPEVYEYVIEQLLAAGAQDAWLTPVLMKKGRPAVTVSVLCSREIVDIMRSILFRETGTLGVRASEVSKTALDRESLKVETTHGTVAVKVGMFEGRAITVSPEYEDCARLARESGVAVRDVYDEAAGLARRELGTEG
jgi:pyridinium-3,5-bisthiocarboxylic acid mononucleotide nickel chelatase